MPLVWRAGHLKGVCASKFWVPWPEPHRGRCSTSPGEWGAAGGLPYVYTLPSSHQNWILFRAAMCLLTLLWLMRSEQSPGWHFRGSLWRERMKQAHTFLPFTLPFLLPNPWAWGMEFWWPSWNLTDDSDLISKDETQEEPESLTALRGCHVTRGHLPSHFCRREELILNLSKLLLPNIPKFDPNAMPVQPIIQIRSS